MSKESIKEIDSRLKMAEDAEREPVSYTHLTLPTTRSV